MTKCVIVENDISQWDDQTGVLYHFPKRYEKFLTPGSEVIYYKGSLKQKSYTDKRLSDLPHYFGVATIGKVFRDKSSSKGDLFATIENYKEFSEAVLAKNGDTYLEEIPLSKINNYWRDGVRVISEEVYERITSATSKVIPQKSIYDEAFNDLDASLVSGEEGKKKQSYVTTYERRPELRKAAIAIHGFSCSVCDFNFGKFYGDYAEGYIHIHHITPVSELTEPSKVNPQTDLVPVCANCHSIIHRKKNRTLSIDELRSMIKVQSS